VGEIVFSGISDRIGRFPLLLVHSVSRLPVPNGSHTSLASPFARTKVLTLLILPQGYQYRVSYNTHHSARER
jgi:hypothetical protein